MSWYSYENSFVLTELLKGSQGPSEVPGPHFENHCPRATLYMCVRRHAQEFIHSSKHLPCARHCECLNRQNQTKSDHMGLHCNGQNVHTSIVCNSPKLKTIQISMNRRTDKLWYSHVMEYYTAAKTNEIQLHA